jgi:hypothetical protein
LKHLQLSWDADFYHLSGIGVALGFSGHYEDAQVFTIAKDAVQNQLVNPCLYGPFPRGGLYWQVDFSASRAWVKNVIGGQLGFRLWHANFLPREDAERARNQMPDQNLKESRRGFPAHTVDIMGS